MAGRQDIEAGSAFIRLYVKDDDVAAGMDKAREELASVRDAVNEARSAIQSSGGTGFSIGGLSASSGELSKLTSASNAASRAIASLRASASSPIVLHVSQHGSIAGASRVATSYGSAASMEAMLRLNSPRFVATSGMQGNAFTSRKIVTNEGVYARSGVIGDLLGIGRRGDRAEFQRLRNDLMAGKSGDALGEGRRFLVRTTPTASDMRSVNQISTPAGTVSRSSLAKFQGRGEFDKYLQSRTGTGGASAPVASQRPASANATTPVAAQARAAPAPSMVSQTASAIAAQSKAVASAASAMASPVTQSISMANRLRIATSAAGASMMGLGIRFGIAGAAIASIALPLKMVTDRFASSAVKVQEYAEKYGVSIDEALKKTNSSLTANQVKLGVALAKSWGNIRSSASKAWDSVAAAIGEALSPQLTERAFALRGAANAIAAAGKTVGKWAAENKSAVSGILAVSAAAAVTGSAVVGLGTVLGALGASLTVLGGVAAALVSPMAIATAAIVGGVYAWTTYTESGKAALASLVNTLRPFVGVAQDTMSGVTDAIVAGDLAGAWNIASTGLKLASAMGMQQLAEIVGGGVGETILAIGTQIAAGDFVGAWSTSVTAMGAVWDALNAGIVTSFTAAMNLVIDQFANAVGSITKMAFDMLKQDGAVSSIVGRMLGLEPGQLSEMLRNYETIVGKLDGLNSAPSRTAGERLQEAAVANAQTAATPVRSVLDEMDKAAAERQQAGRDSLSAATAKPRAEADTRVQQLRDELDQLRADAKKKADEVRAKGLQADAPDPAKAKGGQATQGMSGTFSAAAISGGAFGLGPAERMARDIAEQKRILNLSLEEQKELRQVMKNFGLTWGA